MSYRHSALFESDPSQIPGKREDQWFDRKSVNVSTEKLANFMKVEGDD